MSTTACTPMQKMYAWHSYATGARKMRMARISVHFIIDLSKTDGANVSFTVGVTDVADFGAALSMMDDTDIMTR